MYETPDTAYGLTLVRRGDDRQIALTTYSRNGINGMTLNDSVAAWRWGRRTYRSYKKAVHCSRIYGDGVVGPDE